MATSIIIEDEAKGSKLDHNLELWATWNAVGALADMPVVCYLLHCKPRTWANLSNPTRPEYTSKVLKIGSGTQNWPSQILVDVHNWSWFRPDVHTGKGPKSCDQVQQQSEIYMLYPQCFVTEIVKISGSSGTSSRVWIIPISSAMQTVLLFGVNLKPDSDLISSSGLTGSWRQVRFTHWKPALISSAWTWNKSLTSTSYCHLLLATLTSQSVDITLSTLAIVTKLIPFSTLTWYSPDDVQLEFVLCI